MRRWVISLMLIVVANAQASLVTNEVEAFDDSYLAPVSAFGDYWLYEGIGVAVDPVTGWTNTVLWWEMKNSNDPTEDSSFVGTNTGVIGGATYTTATNGYSFDGNDNINGNSGERLNITDYLTIAAWVKFDGVGTYNVVMTKGEFNTPASAQGLTFHMQRTSANALNAGYYNSDPAPPHNCGYNSTAAVFPSANVWYHVAATFDWVNDSILAYVDGVIKPGTMSATRAPVSKPTEDMHIGGLLYNGGLLNQLVGDCDEALIFDRVLTSNEVYQLMLDTNEGKQ